MQQRNLARETIAEQPGDAQSDVDPRPPYHRDWQNLIAAHAIGRMIPDRARAEQGESLRDIVAAGAHGRAAPEIEDDPPRPFAMVLRVAGDDLLGGAPPDFPGRARRHGARIDAVKIAPGRQHIEPPARRRARRTRLDETAVERSEQPRHSSPGAGVERNADRRGVGAALLQQNREIFCARFRGLGLFAAEEHTQPVADAHVLRVGQPGVEAGTSASCVGIEVLAKPRIPRSKRPGLPARAPGSTSASLAPRAARV